MEFSVDEFSISIKTCYLRQISYSTRLVLKQRLASINRRTSLETKLNFMMLRMDQLIID